MNMNESETSMKINENGGSVNKIDNRLNSMNMNENRKTTFIMDMEFNCGHAPFLRLHLYDLSHPSSLCAIQLWT